VAVDRGERATLGRLRVAQRNGIELRTSTLVLAQVWRDASGRQAALISHDCSAPLTSARWTTVWDVRRACLLGRAGTTDPIEATIVLTAAHGDRILTSDPDDLGRLAVTCRRVSRRGWIQSCCYAPNAPRRSRPGLSRPRSIASFVNAACPPGPGIDRSRRASRTSRPGTSSRSRSMSRRWRGRYCTGTTFERAMPSSSPAPSGCGRPCRCPMWAFDTRLVTAAHAEQFAMPVLPRTNRAGARAPRRSSAKRP